MKIDPELPLDQAALFGCAVLTGVGAVVNTAGVRAGQSVAVVGLGGVGLASLLGAGASGARQIVAMTSRTRSSLWRKTWAPPLVFNAAAPNCIERIRKATSGGVDYAIEMAGSVRAFDLAYRITRRGGTTATAGLPPPAATWALAPVHLVAEERTVKGSYIGTCVPSRDLPHYIELYRQGRLPVDRLMSGKLHLEEINRGFDLLHEGKAVRQVITFD